MPGGELREPEGFAWVRRPLALASTRDEMRSKRNVIALGLCVLAGIMTIVFPFHPPRAEASGGLSITVEPTVATEADVIEVTVKGTLPYPASCYDISSSHVLIGNTIEITVQVVPVGVVCTPVLGVLSATEEIGRLPVGVYQVEATATICLPPPCSVTATFTVVSGSVGGIAELPEANGRDLQTADSSRPAPGLLAGVTAAVAAGVLILGGAAWHRKMKR